ncbi:oligosaccharide repeat unit polymerase family protein [Methanobrevibacter sp. TMH8]|uniref:oligosaccharide repeat unit polymerase family protein n=1 Tax=Methanobrevibacter sp. TMH8 TaxID=2848611 RepID=UPI001CCE3F43|nr:oligosaccharide repeat unit polymerase family protein [Methanobrevibacter sp. TMH8]MBZ9570374.1 oligosaccharide repeat unit polymerase family protein [Methanobrevibacter sp. TMH8]
MNLKKNNLKSKIENIDIFNPYVLIILIIAFILIAIPALYFSDELPSPTFQVYLYIILGILFFILGVNFPKILSKFSKSFKNKIKTLKSINFGKSPSIPSFDFSKFESVEYIILAIVLIGIILQIINFLFLGGIPLFSGILKAKAATKIWLFSYIFFIIGINLLLSKYNRKIYYLLLIIGLGMFSLTGYRTTPIAILLSVFITLYYSRNMKIRYQIMFTAIIAILLIVVGFIAVQAIQWQHWRLNAIELISYRAGFTLNILDRAIPLAGSTHGDLFYYTLTGFFKSVDPRVLVGETVLGESHSITSTIFGPAILDFGMIGIAIQMFLIGFILKLLHMIQKHLKGIATAFYGIILAQTIVWIETGPTDLVVWLFYLLGIIVIVYYLYNISNSDFGINNYNNDGD